MAHQHIIGHFTDTNVIRYKIKNRKSIHNNNNKKAQLSLTNQREAKACQKLLQFDVLTTLSLTILVFIRLAVGPREILQNSLKIQIYRVQGHPKSLILVPIESAYVLFY